MEKILLPLKAKHFIDTEFYDIGCGCAIDKAAMEFFNLEREDVDEMGNFLKVKDNRYTHTHYGKLSFERDKMMAKTLTPEDVVNTIELIP